MLASIFLRALKKAMPYRGDGEPQLHYFSEEDYGVSSSPFSFYSGKWTLRGKRFFVGGASPRGQLTFFHGLGGGYSSYMQEICALAKEGFLVYAYDNTACMTSEGRSIESLAQTLVDQQHFYAFLEEDETAKGLDRYAAGHSWGGYAVFGSIQKEYRVKRAVCISGFVSLAGMLEYTIPKLKKFDGLLRKALSKGYGPLGDYDVLTQIRDGNTKILYICGDNDVVVPFDLNGAVLMRHFPEGSSPMSYLVVHGAEHNPYWTREAESYSKYVFGKKKMVQRDFDASFAIDYAKLNHDDPATMKAIFDFLEIE